MSYDKLTGIPAAYELFDRLGQYADRLSLTELDVHVAGDDRLGADYLRDVMTIAFSHPRMEGIITWGFWEEAMWRKPAALVARDWTPTVYGRAWLKLVKEEWWTDRTVTTDADGRAVVPEAYFGAYAITGSRGGRESVTEFGHAPAGRPAELVLR